MARAEASQPNIKIEIAELALETAGVSVCTLAPDGRITGLNRTCETAMGLSAQDAIGRAVWDVLAPAEERDNVRCTVLGHDGAAPDGLLGRFRARPGPCIEWMFRAVSGEDGTRRAILAIGTPSVDAGAVSESRERAALLQSVIGTSPEAIVVIDDRGLIREFSPQGERMFGYGAAEVLGRNVSVLMPEPYRREHDGYMAHYFATGEKRIIGQVRELVARRKDGSTFPIELMVDEVFVDDARLFTGFIRDISLRKATEDELRKLNTELIHAGRVAAVGEMTSAIAHEINQPLTAISNYVAACRRLLERPDADPGTVREIAGKAEAQIERTRNIIRHFRSFIRKEKSERDRADINALVNDALALALVGVRESGIATEVRLAPAIPAIFVDRVQVQQVVLNLVRNAVDALADVEDRRLLIATAWRHEDMLAEFAVHDSGPGISDEIRDKLFQPFMTTKPQGMGIGLSLSRSIISAHDGRLWVESNDWGGASFRFVLPADASG